MFSCSNTFYFQKFRDDPICLNFKKIISENSFRPGFVLFNANRLTFSKCRGETEIEIFILLTIFFL